MRGKYFGCILAAWCENEVDGHFGLFVGFSFLLLDKFVDDVDMNLKVWRVLLLKKITNVDAEDGFEYVDCYWTTAT